MQCQLVKKLAEMHGEHVLLELLSEEVQLESRKDLADAEAEARRQMVKHIRYRFTSGLRGREDQVDEAEFSKIKELLQTATKEFQEAEAEMEMAGQRLQQFQQDNKVLRESALYASWKSQIQAE